MEGAIEHWRITKPSVRSDGGVVAAQNFRAAAVGADVLRAGGNAVDAAVATAMALAVVEPWMSGLGGGGYMLVYLAAERRVQVVDFGMIAPRGLDPAAFPLAPGGADDDLFGWPAVEGERNVWGPLSMAVPGSVDGLGLAHEHFGTMPWAELLAPAVALARRGHPIDWWSTLRIASDAATLRENAAARAVYLPDGLPPPVPESGMRYLDMGALAATLERLASEGRRDFYEGEIAAGLVADARDLGGVLSPDDFSAYRAAIVEPLVLERGGAHLHVPPGLSAGPSFADALDRLPAIGPGIPGPQSYAGYAAALREAYRKRFETMGHDGDLRGQGCTTHLSVADAAGNLVSCTNTLLSAFGARVVLPSSGVLMNNGIMWFDPRPGRPNAIAPGVRPLSNMCPLVATREGAPWFAVGASGGRRILPAVFQITSFLVDGGLDLDSAVHQPRINVDGGETIGVDPRLPAAVVEAIAQVGEVELTQAMIAPNKYANPQIALRDGEDCLGAVSIPSPVAAAVGA